MDESEQITFDLSDDFFLGELTEEEFLEYSDMLIDFLEIYYE
jgi:hypothetical protein